MLVAWRHLESAERAEFRCSGGQMTAPPQGLWNGETGKGIA